MESNSFSNHTSDLQNLKTAKRESDLLITRIITNRIGRQEGLLPISQNYDKKLRKKLDIGYTFS